MSGGHLARHTLACSDCDEDVTVAMDEDGNLGVACGCSGVPLEDVERRDRPATVAEEITTVWMESDPEQATEDDNP